MLTNIRDMAILNLDETPVIQNYILQSFLQSLQENAWMIVLPRIILLSSFCVVSTYLLNYPITKPYAV
jgi:hypothetical protein